MRAVASLKFYLKSCADAFDHTQGYPLADRILTSVFSAYPKNDSLDIVLHKVALLNALYRTQIFDVYGMAEHVLGRGLDTYLKRGNIEAVALLRKGHGFKSKNRRERDLYSFATKYCHWHRPDVYPMYDYYVDVALRWLNRKLEFKPAFSKEKLRDYAFFLGVVDACRASLKLDWPGYKRLDQALWILGQLLEGDADNDIVQAVGKLPNDI